MAALAARCDRELRAAPATVYAAFTRRWEDWFAAPGSFTGEAVVGGLFRFETEFDGRRHPHYGRYLTLEPDRRVQLTWVTGVPGTGGAETVVTLDIEPRGSGSRVRLEHSGFADREARDGHAEAWPAVFEHLDATLAS